MTTEGGASDLSVFGSSGMATISLSRMKVEVNMKKKMIRNAISARLIICVSRMGSFRPRRIFTAFLRKDHHPAGLLDGVQDVGVALEGQIFPGQHRHHAFLV